MTQNYDMQQTDKKERGVLGTLIIWILIALGATLLVNVFFGGWLGLISFAITAGFWVLIGYFLRGYVDRRRKKR